MYPIRILALAGLLVLPLFMVGCGQKSATPATSKKLSLAFVSNNPSPFWTIARAGCRKAEAELDNVSVDFRMPASGSAAEQQQVIEDLLARGVDGVAMSPIDPVNQTGFMDRVASQALLVTADSDAPSSKRACYIGTDNVAAGVEAAKLIKQALPNGGKIMMFVGTMDAQNAKDRYAGIIRELAGSGIEVIDVRTDETDRVRAQKNVEDTLVRYPDVAGLIGLWSYNGPAIVNAVRTSGKSGHVKIVCFDEEDVTLAAVASGEVFATIVQRPFEFGRQAVIAMAQYLRGDKAALAGGRRIIPTREITRENVAAFQAELKTLLSK
jgi:ribose transport system substrate-binding protein